ncbi:hypothetical protein [Streptosporangium saharense]|uniref:hypothetical protein n=1 Tax=Streptosporangium saharense TaxID=1706840 RepID=UPI0034392927
MEPVLIMGGSGQAGAGTAAVLRQWHPELPLTLAGRDLDRVRKVADGLGAATAVTIDLRRGDLGLPDGQGYSAVVAAVWDSHLNGLRYAQGHGLPYLSISNGLVDLAPEVFAVAQRTSAAPVLLASHSFAGLAVLAALDAARRFERIDSIRIALILDELDAGGPAAVEDLDRLTAVTSAGLVRRDGVFVWVGGEEARVEVATVDGVVLSGQTIAIPDVPSVALATGAPNVRFDFAVGESAGRRGGGPASVEVGIDLEGTGLGGTPLRVSRRLAHPEGQRPLTALGVALGVERLIGLRGEPVAPGVHAPEALLDPALAVERMVDAGTVLTDT